MSQNAIVSKQNPEDSYNLNLKLEVDMIRENYLIMTKTSNCSSVI